MTTTPTHVPDLIEMTAAAICNNDNHGVPWDQVRKATAERYRRLAVRVLNTVAPEIERQERERLAEDIAEPTVWPDPFGRWTADQADAARAMKAHIRRRITRSGP